jgi:TPR repeat protein
MRLLAQSYAEGRGTTADSRLAKKWYLNAVAAGDPDAKAELAKLVAKEKSVVAP